MKIECFLGIKRNQSLRFFSKLHLMKSNVNSNLVYGPLLASIDDQVLKLTIFRNYGLAICCHRYIGEMLPIRCKTQDSQDINTTCVYCMFFFINK